MDNNSSIDPMRTDAAAIFFSALDAVEPSACVERFCHLEGTLLSVGDGIYSLDDYHHVYVVGAGKASASMALAIEHLFGSRITRGLINVKYHHTTPLKHINLIEAGHPLPDENGVTGSKAILDILSNAGRGDLVICLISGGGSALLPLPVEGLNLKDKQETTDILLSCGASIREMNAIRKHMSQIKGGRLAKAAYPAQVISLILSDVVGDRLDVIASGPTVPDSSTFQDCMGIFEKYHLFDKLPKIVIRYFQRGIEGSTLETPKLGDSEFENVQNVIIGNNRAALLAASETAKARGYETLILSSVIEGETREIACMHTAIAKEIIKTGNPLSSPACILSGGETTVTLAGKGRGGRNQEFALAGAIDIQNEKDVVILSAGTDGTDGPTDAAGAIVDSHTYSRARALGMDPEYYLRNNDSYHFFESLGDLFVTGPTNTNVMDLRIMLIR